MQSGTTSCSIKKKKNKKKVLKNNRNRLKNSQNVEKKLKISHYTSNFFL